MIVKIKKLNKHAVIPKYAKSGDAGMDLIVTEVEKIGKFKVKYKFGLALEIPKRHYGMIVPRSSVMKSLQILSNSCGIIDSGYRGEIMVVFYRIPKISSLYKVGDRVAQLIIMPHPYVEFEESEELSKTTRGSGGFGSTGK